MGIALDEAKKVHEAVMSVAKSNEIQDNNAISSDTIDEIFGEESSNNPKPSGRMLCCYNESYMLCLKVGSYQTYNKGKLVGEASRSE